MKTMTNITILTVLGVLGCGQMPQEPGTNTSTDTSTAMRTYAPAQQQPAQQAAKSDEPQQATYYNTEAGIPACNRDLLGVLIYVASSRTFRYCDGLGSWLQVDMSQWAGDSENTDNQDSPASQVLVSVMYRVGSVDLGSNSNPNFQDIQNMTADMPSKVSTFHFSPEDFNAAVGSNLTCVLDLVNDTMYSCSYLTTDTNCSISDNHLNCVKPTITTSGEYFPEANVDQAAQSN